MKTMAKTGISYADWGWNVAPGCTKGCDGCWARACAKRNQHCELCREFVPHMHEERLEQPANTKKPGVVAVNFMGDLWDPANLERATFSMVNQGARNAPQHTYLWLTQRPLAMLRSVQSIPGDFPNWHFGVTIRGPEFDAARDILLDFPVPVWLSMEPLLHYVHLGPLVRDHHLSGVVVGSDRRKSVLFSCEWARAIVAECRDAKVPVYVKQLHIDGKVTANIKDFPKDLQVRELPWGDKLQERAGT